MAAVATLIGAPALIGLTRKSNRRVAGELVEDGSTLGHRMRDRQQFTPPRETQRVGVLIVGGGMAGLSAAWELDRRGFHDVALLEMASQAGGNARSGENEITAYPWAAHYVPVPAKDETLARELFEELGVLRDGVWDERTLCFAPQERMFIHGQWRSGIEPDDALDRTGRDEFRRFAELMDEHRHSGQFTIPMARGAPRESPLDRMSMAQWLADRGFSSTALKWYVDYACRDDYGALASETSAWAGVHYFASRQAEEQGPLTWPEGNGWIAKKLIAKLGKYIQTDSPAYHIERRGNRWRVMTPRIAYDADVVVFAAPTFLAPYLVDELRSEKPDIVYSPWVTANLTLDRWPAERGVEPAWDNVIYDSPGLGYVVATHQSLSTRREPTVWTYYRALAGGEPSATRQWLLKTDWSYWRDAILSDLERAHPDIRECVARVDVLRLGHAMVRPAVGFLSDAGSFPARPLPRFHLANSDRSGLSLFEEAQYRGVAAARLALMDLGGS